MCSGMLLAWNLCIYGCTLVLGHVRTGTLENGYSWILHPKAYAPWIHVNITQWQIAPMLMEHWTCWGCGKGQWVQPCSVPFMNWFVHLMNEWMPKKTTENYLQGFTIRCTSIDLKTRGDNKCDQICLWRERPKKKKKCFCIHKDLLKTSSK